MSRFFKSAAFPILIVVVLAFFAQKLIGNSSHTQKHSFGNLLTELQSGQVRSLTLKEKDNTASVTTTDGIKYTVGFPDQYTPTLIDDAHKYIADQTQFDIQGRASNGWLSLLNYILPFVIFIGSWIFLMNKVQGGGSKVMSFGKSRAKRMSVDSPKITFRDVAGVDEAVEELHEIKEFLENPKKFQALGARIPKGVLLFGPPGTGKTLLARAVGGEAGVPFFSISGSDFVEMFVGVGASRVRDLFEQGKKHAPCIIFIDEIDAVGRHRGAGLGGGHDEREQTLNQLLVEMDGFESNEGVILIAATNRPDVLDPALLRPGRFDPQGVLLPPAVAPRVVARCAPGSSGAALASLVNEAALRAARVGKRLVTMADFEYAKDKVLMGTERRSMAMTDEEKKLTAYHEAGHALVAMHVPKSDPLHKVTIIPRGRALGVTMQLPERDHLSHTKQFLESRLAIMFGGRTAEEIIFGPENVTTGAASDIQVATQTARGMITAFGMSEKLGRVRYQANEQEVFLGHAVTQTQNVSEATAQLIDQEGRRLIEEAEGKARQILTDHLEDLHTIAKALLEYEMLSRDEIDQVLRGEKVVRDDTGGAGSGSDRRRRASVPTSTNPAPGGANPEPQPGV